MIFVGEPRTAFHGRRTDFFSILGPSSWHDPEKPHKSFGESYW